MDTELESLVRGALRHKREVTFSIQQPVLERAPDGPFVTYERAPKSAENHWIEIDGARHECDPETLELLYRKALAWLAE